ncbi:hypothetical protein K2Z83_02210 [Oscillochloris sp. ZM17-4]|uniref:hypothetical protein n=1 Tax=Oscillochloris sp. ZM17-4 TaxID=2866714 RepID=UPI001C73DE35|nr:hypothetical protein [Oscillochloris sp. ZM17-4]MBX0326507.1 hypothetical protein [Oscillochloris sp. ZM17-4]
MARRSPALAILAVLLLAPLLSGCLLISGERTTIDLLAGSGNVSTTFVSAEGGEERAVQVSDGPADLQAIAIIAIESGDLQIDLLQPDGAVAFAIAGRPDSQVTRSSRVRSDDAGMVRYRVTARGARSGEYQIFFQP